jgi:hypothetical protein
VEELDRDGWELRWSAQAPAASYRGKAHLGCCMGKSYVNLYLSRPAVGEDGRPRRLYECRRVTCPEDVSDALRDDLRRWVRLVEELTDQMLPRQGAPTRSVGR